MINQSRSANGLPGLSVNAALTATAESYARLHRLSTDPFKLDHYLDGAPGDRARRHGYTGLTAEVLVSGPISASVLMDAWLGSSPHRNIVLGGEYRDIGIGCYWAPYTNSEGINFDIALCVGNLGAP